MFHHENIPLSYLAEIGFRSTVMFLVLIFALKLLSKRGVKQLSVFELAILIALGSATGDPMFYYDIPLTYGIVVLIVVILLYKVITGLTGKSKKLETLLEGKPVCLLKEGRIEYAAYKKIGLPYDKFFAELRLKSVTHLGQVKKVYLETSGEVSVYFFEDKEVKEGLPIFPELKDHPLDQSPPDSACACIHCGHVQHLIDPKSKCLICANQKWLPASSEARIT